MRMSICHIQASVSFKCSVQTLILIIVSFGFWAVTMTIMAHFHRVVGYGSAWYASMAVSTVKGYLKANRTVPLFGYPFKRIYYTTTTNVNS